MLFAIEVVGLTTTGVATGAGAAIRSGVEIVVGLVGIDTDGCTDGGATAVSEEIDVGGVTDVVGEMILSGASIATPYLFFRDR